MAYSLYLLTAALLLLLSIFSSKLSLKYGIPALLIFLGIGMIFGSDALNVVYFDDYQLAQHLGIIALIYILFSGGLDTNWQTTKPIAIPGLILATIGVLITALIVGYLASLILDVSLLQGMLLGAVVSSTDAAAVFSVLRSKALGFKYQLKELLEFESGTNDPMAIFLTIGIILYLTVPDMSWDSLIMLFVLQMSIGLITGLLSGKLMTWIINHANLGYDGLYPVLMLSFVPLIYAATDLLGGSGFLAVYIAGLVMGNSIFVHRRSLMNFFDGVGWLMQITMFLTLGLLVFPSQLVTVAGSGLLLAVSLIVVGRPVSVFLSMIFTDFNTRSKLMVSWVGLRGAAPIILATFPYVAGIENAELFFSIVFFVVVTSVLIQGPTLPFVARLLKVASPIEEKTRYPIELEPTVDTKAALEEVEIEEDDFARGKKVHELGLPEDVLITLINREGKFMVPRGTTEIAANDKLLILSSKNQSDYIRLLLKAERAAKN
ncbi:potassium/proton antiporter [Aliifodinibius sp. S!AR15-10]|uniref:potassium/proton antiporter n=1 Tax=Aliifodinibius sp. S!AR15-10 TaxID=2950437 RepID=UPI00285CA608|nr:potassium/proton antiporter [Aliifodinibius sp. S!AR15-10]MDR8390031.1 potassium/proton antiporter [Aliifodinibius sp. S!AR15-10]